MKPSVASRLRVTWICLEWPNEGWHTGGVARHSYRMAEMAKEYVDLSVVSFEGGFQIDGVTHHFVRRPRGRFDRYYLSPAAVRGAVARSRPDVVHSHGDDWFIPKHYPMVRTFYGMSSSEAKSSSGLRKLNHYVLALLEMRSARRSDVKVAIAPESYTAFGCDILSPPVGNDVRSSASPKSAVPSVVFVGSFYGRKRGWLVERVVELVRAGSANVSLTVIGPADDRDCWQEWVNHKSGLTDDEVADEVARSWVLLAPSEYEGFGLPVFEALEVRTRVIASSNPGSEYLSMVGGRALPLQIVGDADLADAVRSIVDGTSASAEQDEAEACRQLSAFIRKLSDIDTTVGIYRRLAAAHG